MKACRLMMSNRKIRILLSKIGLDAHDIGVRLVAAALRNRGMEVVYLGLYQTPANIVSSAIEEDVDVIGLSITGGAHLVHVAEVIKTLRNRHCDIPVIVGGVIPQQDVVTLKELGVSEVFPSRPLSVIAEYIEQLAKR